MLVDRGNKVVGRISFAWDTEATGPARLTTRSIDLRDFPPDRPSRVSRFFQRNALLSMGLLVATVVDLVV